MKRMMIRVGLSLMVAAGWWVQQLPAQSPSAAAPAPLLVIQTPIAPTVPPPVISKEAPPEAPKHSGKWSTMFHNYGRC